MSKFYQFLLFLIAAFFYYYAYNFPGVELLATRETDIYYWNLKVRLIFFQNFFLFISLFTLIFVFSRTSSYNVSFFSLNSKYKIYLYYIFFIFFVILIYNFYHYDHINYKLCSDYHIYAYFAKAYSEHQNPYNLSEKYIKDSIEPKENMVSKQYADYPPSLMLLYGLIYKYAGYYGLFHFFQLMFAFSLVLYIMLFIIPTSKKSPFRNYPIYIPFVLLFIINTSPLFNEYFLLAGYDKSILMFFAVCLIFSSTCINHYFIACLAAAALKGLGFPAFLIYLKELCFSGVLNLRSSVLYVSSFIALLLLTFLPFFPWGFNSYYYRFSRYKFVAHQSFYVLLKKFGLYADWLPWIILFIFTFYLIYAKINLEYLSSMIIIAFCIFSTEAGIERLLVAVFIMMVYQDNLYLLAFNYIFFGNISLTCHWSYHPTKLKSITGLSIIWILIAVNLTYFLITHNRAVKNENKLIE